MNATAKTSRDAEFERELTGILNKHSQESVSDTSDFILAQFLLGCLAAWNAAVQQRDLSRYRLPERRG